MKVQAKLTYERVVVTERQVGDESFKPKREAGLQP